MKKLSLGLIGAGNIAGKYVEAVKGLDTGVLAGVIDIQAEKARGFAETHDVPNWAESMRDLFHKTDIDAVIIATPSGLHSELAVKAAEYGKHILCEKPLDVTLEKIDAMISTCRRMGVRLGCAFQHRTSEHNAIVHDIIQTGKLGRIYIANAFLKCHRTQEYYDSAAWRGTWALDGGGPFMQQAAHTVDLMVWMMGRGKQVWAVTDNVAHQIEVEDMGHAIVKYENGAQGVLEVSTVVTPGYPNRLEIHGEKGSVILNEHGIEAWDIEGVKKPQLSSTSQSGGFRDPMAIGIEGHRMIVKDFIEAVNQGKEPLVSSDSARMSVELICAIYESARTGKTVSVV